jgi:hypothetical protein
MRKAFRLILAFRKTIRRSINIPRAINEKMPIKIISQPPLARIDKRLIQYLLSKNILDFKF